MSMLKTLPNLEFEPHLHIIAIAMARKPAENLGEQWSYERIDKALQYLLDQPKGRSRHYKYERSISDLVRRFILKDYELKTILER